MDYTNKNGRIIWCRQNRYQQTSKRYFEEGELNKNSTCEKWFEYLGKDFYIEILEIARENLPEGTKMFYNEYRKQNLEKRKAIIQVIENIKKYEQQIGKVLLDGIGTTVTLWFKYNRTTIRRYL